MTERKSKKKNMVYTPQQHIPMGEAIKTASGEPALLVKKPNCSQYEIIPIGALVSQVAQAAESST